MQHSLPTFRSFLKHLLAVLSIGLTTGILYLLGEVLDTPLIALLYLLPVGLSTAMWGLAPGILAALSACLLSLCWVILPTLPDGASRAKPSPLLFPSLFQITG